MARVLLLFTFLLMQNFLISFRDQRITQDVERFCETFRKVIIVVVVSPFTITYYTYLCYQR